MASEIMTLGVVVIINNDHLGTQFTLAVHGLPNSNPTAETVGKFCEWQRNFCGLLGAKASRPFPTSYNV